MSNTRVVSTRIPEWQAQLLDKMAESLGLSKSEVLENAMCVVLGADGKPTLAFRTPDANSILVTDRSGKPIGSLADLRDGRIKREDVAVGQPGNPEDLYDMESLAAAHAANRVRRARRRASALAKG